MKTKRRSIAATLALLLLLSGGVRAEGVVLNVYGKGGAGEWDNPVLQEEHPEISWSGGDVLSGSAQDLVQALTARQPYDLYALNYTDQNFCEIMQKGFALRPVGLSCFERLRFAPSSVLEERTDAGGTNLWRPYPTFDLYVGLFTRGFRAGGP